MFNFLLRLSVFGDLTTICLCFNDDGEQNERCSKINIYIYICGTEIFVAASSFLVQDTIFSMFDLGIQNYSD